jgi:hypothetical protein
VVEVLAPVISQWLANIFLAKKACTGFGVHCPIRGILIESLVLAVYPSHPSQLERILTCLDLEISETLPLHGPGGTYYAAPFQSSYQGMYLLVDRMHLLVQVAAQRSEGSTIAEVDDLASVEADN